MRFFSIQKMNLHSRFKIAYRSKNGCSVGKNEKKQTIICQGYGGFNFTLKVKVLKQTTSTDVARRVE